MRKLAKGNHDLESWLSMNYIIVGWIKILIEAMSFPL